MEKKYSNLIKELLKKCKNCGEKLGDTTDFYSVSVKVDDSEIDEPHAVIHRGIPYIDAVCSNCGYIHSFSKDILDKKSTS